MIAPRRSDPVQWERLADAQWRPLQPGPGALEFNLFSLAMAAARMQLTYLTPRIMQAPPEAQHESFRRHTRRMFEDLQMLIAADAGDGMALVAPPAHWLMDFERTTLAGRIGAGFSMLVMCGLGYWYVGPYDVVTARPAKRTRAPDFVFSRSAHSRALVEAKGSFSPRGRIRETARKALQRQVLPALSNLGEDWGCAIASGVTTRSTGRPSIVLCDQASPQPPIPSGPEAESSASPLDPFFQWSVANPALFRAHWTATLAFCGFPASARAMWAGEPMSKQALAEDGLGEASRLEAGVVFGSKALVIGPELGKLQCGLDANVATGLRAMLGDADTMRFIGRFRLGLGEWRPAAQEGTAERPIRHIEALAVSALGEHGTQIRFPDGVACRLKRIEREEDEPRSPYPSRESGYERWLPVASEATSMEEESVVPGSGVLLTLTR